MAEKACVPLTLTHDEISRFFSEEYVKKAFQFPNWPAGTEIVCYCRSTDSRDAIEQIAQRGGWKIVKYVHIDELPIAKLYKPGQVMFAIREVLEWKRDSTLPSYEEWCNQMLGGLRPSDWDKFKTNYSKQRNNETDLHDCSRRTESTRLGSRD